jgi:hypothetical protein
MNRLDMIRGIAENVRKLHPRYVPQERYLKLFAELPHSFVEERQAFDNLIEKQKSFKLCRLQLDDVKVEIKLTLDECIDYELALDKWADARAHNILPSDIKKLLKTW